jgi:FdrA protein
VAEARKAIRGGLHAMIFSDNVSLEQEVQLKQEARELGRLVMGPDCGTAIINGVALAFANQVTRGSIGVIGASGTGTQEVSCLISQYEGGISHAIGVGGRDLKTEVGGISTLMAIDALDADPGTSHLVFVSKPPPASVASIILERIAESKKTATICFLGADVLLMPANAKQVFTLKAAAQHAVGISDDAAAEAPSGITTPNGRNLIHGLFSGGTLCAEAQVILRANNESMKSNAPIPGVPSLTDGGAGHIMIDLGDDEYTQGKPHPMIDPTVRDATIIESINNTTVGVVLVDVVIGFGAHEDPAGYLASVLKANTLEDGPIFIASVTGTEEDPQVRSVQIAKLEAAGVRVASNNADAAEWALAAIRSSG